MDINTPWFYLSRKNIIDCKIKEIMKYTNNEIIRVIDKIYLEHFGEECIGIYWDNYNKNEFMDICQCIGGFGLSQICNQLSKNYRYWAAGLPDLFLWKVTQRNKEDDKIILKGECKIIEVKGPRDKLSDKQSAWLVYLKDKAKLDALVVFVKE